MSATALRKDSARSWVIIVFVGLALTIAQVDRTLLAIASPTLIEHLHLSGTEIGILLSSFAWTFTALQLPAGSLVDRFGPRKILAIAFVLWSVACSLTGFASAFGTLLACRLALGIAESPLYGVAHSTMAGAFTERRRGLATAIYTKSSSLGPALGAAIGSWLLLTAGWRVMFLFVGATSLVFLVPWLIVVPRNFEQAAFQRTRARWSDIRHLLRSRSLWGIALGYFGFLYIYFISITWLPVYLAKERGMSTMGIAWMASVPFLVSLITGPAAGFVADLLIDRGHSVTVVRKASIAFGLLLCAAVIPAVFATEAETAAILFVVYLAGQAIAATNMLALPSTIAPEGRAGFVGTFQQMFGSLGGVVSPILTGVLYDRTHSFELAIAVAGTMLLLSAICFIIVVPRIEQLTLPEAEAEESATPGRIRHA